MKSNIEIKNLSAVNKERNYRIEQIAGLGYTVITPSDLFEIAVTLKKKGYRNNTIRVYISELRGAIKRYCLDRNLYDTAYTYDLIFSQLSLKNDKECVNQSDLITLDKLPELLTFARDKKMKLIVVFLLTTGVRVNEFCNIRLKDCRISKDENLVYIRIIQGKNNKSRETVIPIELYYAIRELHGIVYLFENNEGRKFQKPSLSRRLTRIAKRYGQRLHPHLFRHSHITMMLGNGYDMKQLSKLCGVMPETMVRTYYHVKVDYKGAAEMTRPMLNLLQ